MAIEAALFGGQKGGNLGESLYRLLSLRCGEGTDTFDRRGLAYQLREREDR